MTKTLTEELQKKIFKLNPKWEITNDFLEEQELIRNLLETLREKHGWSIGSSWYENALEKPLELAINSKNTRNLINSNTKLASSNKKYQVALNRLTWWLVFVGLVQIIIELYK